MRNLVSKGKHSIKIVNDFVKMSDSFKLCFSLPKINTNCKNIYNYVIFDIKNSKIKNEKVDNVKNIDISCIDNIN